MATAAAEPAARPSPPPRPAPAAPRDRGRERQGEREQAGGGGPVYLLRSEQPQVYLSWGSQMPRAPDRLKLRKVVDFWPVRFTLKADYETRTREFSYGLSCKDKVLKGRFSLNLPHQRIEYRKKLPLGHGAALALAGSCSYANLHERQLDPCFGVQLEFGEFGAGGSSRHAVWAGSTFDVRQKFGVVKGLRLEVCGSAKLPTPTARYRVDPPTMSIGDGAFHIHVAEVNAIVKF